MKTVVLLGALLLASVANADSVLSVDIGPPLPLTATGGPSLGFIGTQQSFPINLSGTPVAGEQDVITITFPSGEFISHDWFFDADLLMFTNGPACAGFTSGTGYFVGKNGQPLSAPVTLGNSCGSNSTLGTGIENAVQPTAPPDVYSIVGTPEDVYGLVFDATFPNEGNTQISSADLLISYTGVTVAEPGTLGLLGVGLAGLLAWRRISGLSLDRPGRDRRNSLIGA